MKYFVTGASGFIGHELVKSLLLRGNKVNILIRSLKIEGLPDTENLKIYRGNLNDCETIEKGMAGCDGVFHLAACANIWSKNKNLPYEVNVTGTKNILDAALKNKVKKIVFTSSAGTLKPSDSTEEIDETDEMPTEYLTDYERTKFLAEDQCRQYCQRGLNIVIVNPSRVYGPGLLNKSNSVTKIIRLYINGKWHIIPGSGNFIGNYVFINDIVDGHIKAMESGRKGEKYILGGENVTFNQLIEKITGVSGKKYKLYKIPVTPIHLFARFSLFFAENFNIKPLITPEWLKRYMQNRALSSKKAVEELNYNITSLETGVDETIKWLNLYTDKK